MEKLLSSEDQMQAMFHTVLALENSVNSANSVKIGKTQINWSLQKED